MAPNLGKCAIHGIAIQGQANLTQPVRRDTACLACGFPHTPPSPGEAEGRPDPQNLAWIFQGSFEDFAGMLALDVALTSPRVRVSSLLFAFCTFTLVFAFFHARYLIGLEDSSTCTLHTLFSISHPSTHLIFHLSPAPSLTYPHSPSHTDPSTHLIFNLELFSTRHSPPRAPLNSFFGPTDNPVLPAAFRYFLPGTSMMHLQP